MTEWDIVLYTTVAGDTPVADFLLSLSQKELDKCMEYIRILSQNGPRLPAQYAKHIEGDIWELRPEFGGVEMRLFYFTFVKNMIVVLHGFKKKSRRTPARELNLAKKRLGELQP